MSVINQARLTQLKAFIPDLIAGRLSSEQMRQLILLFQKKHILDVATEQLQREFVLLLQRVRE